MISRIWRGWTTPENADTYENLLKEEIFPWIEAKNIAGYQGIQLLKYEHEKEVEFMTIMWFDSIENIRDFAGDDYTTAVVPKKAQQVLSHYDARAVHYEVRKKLDE